MDMLGKDKKEYLSNHDEPCKDYYFNGDQYLRYYHNLFVVNAKRFYQNQVRNMYNNFSIAQEGSFAHYSKVSKKNGVPLCLQRITLNGIMLKEVCDVSQRLEKIRNIIVKLAPQRTLHYQIENKWNNSTTPVGTLLGPKMTSHVATIKTQSGNLIHFSQFRMCHGHKKNVTTQLRAEFVVIPFRSCGNLKKRMGGHVREMLRIGATTNPLQTILIK